MVEESDYIQGVQVSQGLLWAAKQGLGMAILSNVNKLLQLYHEAPFTIFYLDEHRWKWSKDLIIYTGGRV